MISIKNFKEALRMIKLWPNFEKPADWDAHIQKKEAG